MFCHAPLPPPSPFPFSLPNSETKNPTTTDNEEKKDFPRFLKPKVGLQERSERIHSQR
ncbi:hypothetical protein COCMIDRAFT_87967 [Bipolaris oryzae ATCC 44560]|uniref:Uncharacterized protein n=1 Tax=Bipolaris oryzae ATCC 44560 TaxID=930090 RepID=W6ZE18_COCMI|nr:uncharacterized protein COCMIDRAFT_87967 [Bipolaris oryzae ATCC 44560]EUC48230.1 hypothetical protein COCMIDRAFT_87967 [Bipolaris oryzae ATCC 44560]